MSDVTKITVNGRQYDSVEQMPPYVREEYLHAMAQLQKAGALKMPGLGKTGTTRTIVNETITYNGREYTNRDELPPEVRELLEKMPEPSLDDQKTDVTTDVKVETVRTIPSEEFIIKSFQDREKAPAPERDPKIAWMLVSILTVVVVVLLFLLYLAGAGRH